MNTKNLSTKQEVGVIPSTQRNIQERNQKKNLRSLKRKLSHFYNKEEIDLILKFWDYYPSYTFPKSLSKAFLFDNFAEIVKSDNYSLDGINILIRLYTKSRFYEEAVNLLYCYEEHHDVPENIQKKINEIKHDLRMHEAAYFLGKVPHTLFDYDHDEM